MRLLLNAFSKLLFVLIYDCCIFLQLIGQHYFNNLKILTLLSFLVSKSIFNSLNQFPNIFFSDIRRQSPQNKGIITRTVNNFITLLLQLPSFKSKQMKKQYSQDHKSQS